MVVIGCRDRKELIAEYFDMVDEIDWEPHYNIAPTKNVGIIRQGRTQPVRKFALVRWGLIPYWAKDPSIGQKMINARSENILDKPAFREAFQNRRCLVPADGFYEWKRTGRSKQPIHIGMQDDSLFAFPGFGIAGKIRAAISSRPVPFSRPRQIRCWLTYTTGCQLFSNRKITNYGLIPDSRTSTPSPQC